jgi:RNA polymerase sigma-70 factor (ECF subfamily)
LSETDLIQQLIAGNEIAFREIYDRFGKKIFNTCLNHLQNTEEAEDITQEVFVEVFQSIHKFNQESSLSTWIYRIAVNKCIDHIRSKGRKKRFAFLTSLFNPQTGKELKNISSFDHPGMEFEKKEDAQLLFKALNLLPESQRSAFILTQVDDHTQKEAAAILNISEKALESFIQRAKTNLRKHLQEFFKG